MYRSVSKENTGSNKSNDCNESNCRNESNEIQKALKGVSMKKVLAFFTEGTEEIEC